MSWLAGILYRVNDSPLTFHHALLLTLPVASRAVSKEQPVLAMQVGSDIDPGLERKQRPNEDMLFVTHGVIPSPSGMSKPFALLVVADGMGGQGHRREASRLAVQSLADYISRSLCFKQLTSEDFLPLLKEGVKYANRVVYQRNQK